MSDVDAKKNPSSREEIATGFPLFLLFHLQPVSLIRGPVCLLQVRPRLCGSLRREVSTVLLM